MTRHLPFVGLAVVLVTTALVGQEAASPKEVPTIAGRRATPIFSCGRDDTWSQDPIPNWFNVALAADSRLYMPCQDKDAANNDTRYVPDSRDRANVEERLIAAAAKPPSATVSMTPEVALAYGRLRFLPAVGSFFRPVCTPDPAPPGVPVHCVMVAVINLEPGLLVKALSNPVTSSATRQAIYVAIGDIMASPRGHFDEPLPKPDDLRRYVRELFKILLANLVFEKSDPVAGTILETIGRLPYEPSDISFLKVENTLIQRSLASPSRVLGAVRGLDDLERLHPPYHLDEAQTFLQQVVRQLRNLTAPGSRSGRGSTEDTAAQATFVTRARRLALTILEREESANPDLIRVAAGDSDWQLRMLAAQRLNARLPEHQPAAEALRRDDVLQVRWQVVEKLAAAIDTPEQCLPIVSMLDDREPVVVIQVLDQLPAVCSKFEGLMPRLLDMADPLTRTGTNIDWHLPAHAVGAIARFDNKTAGPFIEAAVKHPEWRVRAAAVWIAASLNDEATVVRLALDPNVNVKSPALDALAFLKSTKLSELAIQALESTDYQLVRTAAIRLQGAPQAFHERAIDALLAAMTRLTATESDTSRDPRVAILHRLTDFLPRDRAADLAKWLEDFDPAVRAAAAQAYLAIAQVPPRSVPQSVDGGQVRYPLQPSVDEMNNLPTGATIKIRGGGLIKLLFSTEASVTVARFVSLAKAGYYNGLTVHRVIPNLVAQAGSASDNDYMGDTRFWRDEAGLAPNVRGAVCLSTRGHDTGDGQFFIELVDLPALDHDHTVFATVVQGMEVVERLLDGAVIESVEF